MHLAAGRITLADENLIILVKGLINVVTGETYHLTLLQADCSDCGIYL
jgi:hypothetical protein